MRRIESASPVRGDAELPFVRSLIFTAPFGAMMFLFGPNSYAPQVFARDFGLDLVVLGSVLAVIGILDAISDLLVGYGSDQVRTRWGRRKPLVVLGAGLTLVCSYFLYASPFGITIVYFAVWWFLCQISQTFLQIPFYAWSVELTKGYEARTRLFAYRHALTTLGGLAFAALPLLPIFATGALTPHVFAITFWIALFVVPPIIFLAVRRIPEPHAMDADMRPDHASLRALIRQNWATLVSCIRDNPPYQQYMLNRLILTLGVGLYVPLQFVFFDSYLGIGEAFSQIKTISILSGLLGIPVALIAIRVIKEKRLIIALLGFLNLATHGAFLFLAPGGESTIPFIALMSLSSLGTGVSAVVFPSLAGDVVDYARWRSRKSFAGIYLSAEVTLFKIEYSFMNGVALAALGAFGYQVAATTHTPQEIWALKALFIFVPLIFIFISSWMWLHFPITRRRQAILVQRVKQRHERAARDGADTPSELR